jgi:hypothetical protein
MTLNPYVSSLDTNRVSSLIQSIHIVSNLANISHAQIPCIKGSKTLGRPTQHPITPVHIGITLHSPTRRSLRPRTHSWNHNTFSTCNTPPKSNQNNTAPNPCTTCLVLLPISSYIPKSSIMNLTKKSCSPVMCRWYH